MNSCGAIADDALPLGTIAAVKAGDERRATFRRPVSRRLLPEPDMRLSLRIRLSGRHGEVRRSHPARWVSVDRVQASKYCSMETFSCQTVAVSATTRLIRTEYVTRARFWAFLPQPPPETVVSHTSRDWLTRAGRA